MKIITALITPFNNKNRINYQKLDYLIEKQIQDGADGLVIGGTTGEHYYLSECERKRLYKYVTKYSEVINVYLGISGITSDQVIQEFVRYEHFPICGYLISPPPFVLPNIDCIKKYFLQIAKGTKKKIIIYDIKKRTGLEIPINVLSELCNIPNIIAVKESTNSLNRLKEIVSKNIPLLLGDDKWYLWGLSQGIDGIISVMSNGELALMKEPFKDLKKYREVLEYLGKRVNPVGIKEYLNAKKLDVGIARMDL